MQIINVGLLTCSQIYQPRTSRFYERITNNSFFLDTHGQSVKYNVVGYHIHSNPLVLNNFNSDVYGVDGMELRLWYSEDLYNYHPSDNYGTSCVDVYVMFD